MQHGNLDITLHKNQTNELLKFATSSKDVIYLFASPLHKNSAVLAALGDHYGSLDSVKSAMATQHSWIKLASDIYPRRVARRKEGGGGRGEGGGQGK